MDEEICLLGFNADDDYKKLCGEVFLNSKGLMIFHCTLCEDKVFNGFEIYAQHIEEHKPREISNADEGVSADFGQGIDSDDPCSEVFLQATYSESSDNGTGNEALREAKSSINIFEKNCKSRRKTTDTAEIKKDSGSEANKIHDFSTIDNETKHIEIRPIRKKTNYFPTTDDIRPLQCNLCEATFKHKSSLSKHNARHRTEKIHPCPKCPKMFYTYLDMKKHLVAHLGARPFLCHICGKTLLNGDKLKDHMRRHTNQRDYKCPDCKKRFFNSNLLRDHKLVHKSAKSFACTFCDSKFKFRKGLRNHLKIHENKREYKCDLCEAEFNQQAGLFWHKKSKHQMELNQ